MKKLLLFAAFLSLTITSCSNTDSSFANTNSLEASKETSMFSSFESSSNTYIEYKDYKYVDDWFSGGCYILCWQINNNEWRCGPVVNNGRYTTFSMVDSLQKYIPSTLEEMRIRIEDNYKKESEKYIDYVIGNRVAEIPYPVTEEFFTSFQKRLGVDESLAHEFKNKSVYDALGLEEIYGRLFDDEYESNLFPMNKEDMVDYAKGDRSKYSKDLYGLENSGAQRMVNSALSGEEAIENAKWAYTNSHDSVSSFSIGRDAVVERETEYYYLLNVTHEYYENKYAEPVVNQQYTVSLKKQYCEFYPNLAYLNQSLAITFSDFSYIQPYMDIYSFIHQHTKVVYSTVEENDDVYLYHNFAIQIWTGDWDVPYNGASLYHYIWTISKQSGDTMFTKTKLVRSVSYPKD